MFFWRFFSNLPQYAWKIYRCIYYFDPCTYRMILHHDTVVFHAQKVIYLLCRFFLFWASSRRELSYECLQCPQSMICVYILSAVGVCSLWAMEHPYCELYVSPWCELYVSSCARVMSNEIGAGQQYLLCRFFLFWASSSCELSYECLQCPQSMICVSILSAVGVCSLWAMKFHIESVSRLWGSCVSILWAVSVTISWTYTGCELCLQDVSYTSPAVSPGWRQRNWPLYQLYVIYRFLHFWAPPTELWASLICGLCSVFVTI